MLHDEHSSEYHADDHQHYVDDAPEELRIRLNFGELTPAPLEQCYHKAMAFNACHELIGTETRPEWLNDQDVP